ncbi:GntR family transcriptional regulator [Streptomyces sp. NPDC093591]|uniref:GntR family transcriptional regulator n=1 Tax=Streptomyces sp. NPDC093591 TaxID=3366044 RepID=UPI0037F7BED4
MSGEHGGDGGGREFERVASALRARMTDGTYAVDTRLPPQRDLAEEFGVSRDTVQRVINELRSEGWIETRQGSGSRVVRNQRIDSPASVKWPDRKVTLGRLIEQAFERTEVTLDVFTLTAESLDAHIRLQAERIQVGEIAPERIVLRVLLPDESLDIPYWRSKSGEHDLLLKERFLDIARRQTQSLRNVMRQLGAEKLVPSVEFQIRRTTLAPTFKLYLVNKEEALFGLYEIYERPIELEDGQEIMATDVRGLAARLTHHVKDADEHSQGTVFVEDKQVWFESAWKFVSEPEAEPAEQYGAAAPPR